MTEEKFLKVESMEFLHDDKEFGGNFAYFKFVFKDSRLIKNELVYSMNKVLAEAIKSTGMFPVRSMPSRNFKQG